jgi:heme exporter protein D
VLPLLTFIYNRWTPKLGGFPFFFWFQIMFTLLAAAVTAIVFVKTKRRS